MQKMLLTRRGRFGCYVYGDPTMPPLVLLMGLGMNSASWPEPFLTRLVRKGLFIIAPDNRDSGASMLGTESVTKTRMFASIAKYIAGGSVHADYRLEDMADDTESVLDELGIERVHVAGISMGGMIAQVFACRAPHACVQTFAHDIRDARHVANYPETDIVFHEDSILQMIQYQSHKRGYFHLWPIPVLRGECI